MSDDELLEIEELAELATPGPWYVHSTDDRLAANALYVSSQPENLQVDPGRGLAEEFPEHVNPGVVVAITLLQNPRLADVADERWDENSQFIAASRSYVPKLILEVRRLRGELAQMRP